MSSSSGGAQASVPAAQAPEAAGASGTAAGQGGPASAGAPPAGPPEPRGEVMSDVEPAGLEQNTEDVDEDMFFLLNIMGPQSEEGVR
eukprot:14348007-Alexandrium_andersonii.AAC.1